TLPCLSGKATAAIINGYTPVVHDRFLADGTPNPGFLLDETQLSGVALQRGVLITPKHFVTAAHIGATEATFRGTDGVERTYQSASWQALTTFVPGVGNVSSDIALHTLTTEVDPSILPVPIVVGDLLGMVGQTLYAFDRQISAGRNVIDEIGIVEFTSGTGDSVAIRYSYDTDTNGGTGGLGADEIGLLVGDSGNAALMLIDGQVGLIGTHMGIDVPAGSNASAGDLYSSFSTVVGAYEDELQAIVSSQGYSLRTINVTAIPEPTSFVCLAILLAGTWTRRRRLSLGRS
ncbi:MAG: hypothetical protein KDB00_03600, partial [Planctomycetales bacterium]|nr:hypothetical protein [Planctomycetales bacterium]